MTKDIRKKARINKRKLIDELVAIGCIMLGLTVFVLNITKTIPIEGITIIIAYGFIIGPVLTIIGIEYLKQVVNTKYPRERTR